jgi:SPP1 gp7 family putative phage head morphogenesis protein
MKVKTVKTAFSKMKKRGIITPPISLTDMTTKSVKEIYHLNLDRLEQELLKHLEVYNVEHDKSVIVKDSIEGLINYLERLGTDSPFVKKILGNVEILLNAGTDLYHYDKLKKRMYNQFGKASNHFFKDLFEDADENLVSNLFKYKLNKNDVFEKRIDDIKELYIDNAINRIAGEQNDLKKRFLQRLTNWVTGESQTIDVKDVITEMKKTAVSEARFFARDQFCKFNKALLIASFKAAGVKRVKLTTCKDRAVRPEHRSWEGLIFGIDNIPNAWWNDYNCRCGAIPIWD